MSGPANSAPSYQFAVSEFTTNPWSFEQDVEQYARLGVEFLEVCEIKLADDDARATAQLAQIDQHGLQISSVQPVVRTLFPSVSQPLPQDVPGRMARFRRTIERFQHVAMGVPFITNTGIPRNGNVQEVLDTAVREYQALADFARDRGVRLALEPLNATIMNVESSIWTLQQGLEIVQAVDRPNFGICLDVWNIWQNADVLAAIEACGQQQRTYIVQLSDWRTPRSYQDRLIPGQGEIPLPTFLRAIHESGYRGPYEVEIFSAGVSDALWDGDLSQLVVDSRAGLDRAWQEAFRTS